MSRGPLFGTNAKLPLTKEAIRVAERLVAEFDEIMTLPPSTSTDTVCRKIHDLAKACRIGDEPRLARAQEQDGLGDVLDRTDRARRTLSLEWLRGRIVRAEEAPERKRRGAPQSTCDCLFF